MTFKLSLVVVVYPPSTDEKPDLSSALLQKANGWLQRRNAGFDDDFLLVGIGFEDELALAAMVQPYGLIGAKMAVEHLERDNDECELGESMSRLASRFCRPEAIPIVNWKGLIEQDVYPMDGWWWVGLEAVDDEQSSLAAILNELLPDAFKPQALTWATILAEFDGLSPDGEAHEAHDAALKAVALARWLNGFDAATKNNFYSFSSSEAVAAAGLDILRLGFEAGRNHESALGDYFDGTDETDEGLEAVCLIACLGERTVAVRSALSEAFGGDHLLFWSLYRCIWPDWKRSSSDNLEELVGLHDVDMGDIDRPWRFVTDGWIDFAEE